MNEPVPRPLRLPTESEVAATEQSLSVTFPNDYRQFLLQASDVAFGTIEPAVVIPDCGYLDLIRIAQVAWQNGVPRNLIPFCEDNGDWYCISPAGQVELISHDGLSSGSWANLAQWIKEVWLNGES